MHSNKNRVCAMPNEYRVHLANIHLGFNVRLRTDDQCRIGQALVR